MDTNQYGFADAQHYGIDICSDMYLGLYLGTHTCAHAYLHKPNI